jgi:hypothetical protein
MQETNENKTLEANKDPGMEAAARSRSKRNENCKGSEQCRSERKNGPMV